MKKNELKRASKYIELRDDQDGVSDVGAGKPEKMRVQEMLEIEEQQQESQKILSKRALQIILRLEEFDWYETEVRGQQQRQLSAQVRNLIELKLEFNQMHVFEINLDINKLTKVWQGVSQTLRQEYQKAQQKVSKEDLIQPLNRLKKAATLKRGLTRTLTLKTSKGEDDTLLRIQEVFTKTNYSCFKALAQLKELKGSAQAFLDELVQDQTKEDLDFEMFEEEYEKEVDVASDNDKKLDDLD